MSLDVQVLINNSVSVAIAKARFSSLFILACPKENRYQRRGLQCTSAFIAKGCTQLVPDQSKSKLLASTPKSSGSIMIGQDVKTATKLDLDDTFIKAL
jgi:hypothetical protein